MKIVSAPDFLGWKKECYCNFCTTTMEISLEDLHYKSVGRYNDLEDCYYVSCPTCKREVTVKDIPLFIKNRISR